MTAPAPARIVTHADLDFLRLGAVHEISHLVVADVCGLKSTYTEIKRTITGKVKGGTMTDPDASGWQRAPGCPDCYQPDQEQIRALLLCCLGGIEGVRAWFDLVYGADSVNGVTPEWGACDDLRDFRTFARCYGFWGMKLSTGQEQAAQLVRRNWMRIERGAGLLYQRRRLVAEQV